MFTVKICMFRIDRPSIDKLINNVSNQILVIKMQLQNNEK